MKIIFLFLAVFLLSSSLVWLQKNQINYNASSSNKELIKLSEVEKILSELSIEEKVGQLFILGHWSTIDPEVTLERVARLHIGGVILMDSGTAPEVKLPVLINSWQASSSLPLFVGIDQEGGVVSRLKEPPHIQTAQPNITTPEQAFLVGSSRGLALSTLGINLNFAPVLEMSFDPQAFLYNRVFRNPADIPVLGNNLINGLREGGVLATAKHYPGHADTSDDSHAVLPILELTQAAYELHTQPFTDTIAQTDIPLLMTAHVRIPSLDPTYPATLSPTIISDLRDRVGYEGIVMTDDMIMRAITSTWSSDEAAVLALKAGVDVLLFAAEPKAGEVAITRVLQALEAGELTEVDIDVSLKRVLQAKKEFFGDLQ